MITAWICLDMREAWVLSRLSCGERREVQTGRREGAECARQEDKRHCSVDTQVGGQPDRNNDKYVEHCGVEDSLDSWSRDKLHCNDCPIPAPTLFLTDMSPPLDNMEQRLDQPS